MIRSKLKAALVHFVLSTTVAILVLAIVYLGWYRDVLSSTEGVGTILLIMLGVDVALGPFLTFIVFKHGKKSLKFDLVVIALMQFGFLAYGLYTVQVGRPAFIVFAKDRFESVAITDWSEESQQALKSKSNDSATRSPWGPVYVATLPPTDEILRSEILLATIEGGADFPQMPQYYVPLQSELSSIKNKSLSIETLKKHNPEKIAEIEAAVATAASNKTSVAYLPLKGKEVDGVVFVNARTGEILSLGLFKPWP